MGQDTLEVTAARQLSNQLTTALESTPSFRHLDAVTQTALRNDLNTIRSALGSGQPSADPYSMAMETPADLARRRAQARQGPGVATVDTADSDSSGSAQKTPGPRVAATETIASRAGALGDEIDFPSFVASLLHGTFDAIVEASIRQMEAFAELVSAVAKDVERFTSENVTPNQVRDWLVQQYPRDLTLDLAGGQPRLRARTSQGDETVRPSWLEDYGLEGEELSDELLEEQLVPAARRRYGENRLQMLATMVLMGMNRINVRDGTISARVRFRANARDVASVDYAVSQDPVSSTPGVRGRSYSQPSMMVSTVGVNVQAESELKAELFGEVRINFVSETLPLERFVDAAQLALLQRNARSTSTVQRGGSTPTAGSQTGSIPATEA